MDKAGNKSRLWQEQYDKYRKTHSQKQAVTYIIGVIRKDPDVENAVGALETNTIMVIFKEGRGIGETLDAP